MGCGYEDRGWPSHLDQLADAARDELLQSFQGRLLPPNHPINIHVTRVVSQLLQSSNLGIVRSEHASSASNTDDEFWQSDAGLREDPVPGSGTKEWTVMVVNDPKTVNAMAAFGTYFLTLSCANMRTKLARRKCRRFHWNITRM